MLTLILIALHSTLAMGIALHALMDLSPDKVYAAQQDKPSVEQFVLMH